MRRVSGGDRRRRRRRFSSLFLWIVPSFAQVVHDRRRAHRRRACAPTARSPSTSASATRSRATTRACTATSRSIRWTPITVTGRDGPGRPAEAAAVRLDAGRRRARSRCDRRQDATPSPWSSIAPEQRPPGYYRVTYDYPTAPSVRIEAFADLSDRAAAFTFTWRAANAAERYADTGGALVAARRQRLGRAHGARAGRGRRCRPGRARTTSGLGPRPPERRRPHPRRRHRGPRGGRAGAAHLRRGARCSSRRRLLSASRPRPIEVAAETASPRGGVGGAGERRARAARGRGRGRAAQRPHRAGRSAGRRSRAARSRSGSRSSSAAGASTGRASAPSTCARSRRACRRRWSARSGAWAR